MSDLDIYDYVDVRSFLQGWLSRSGAPSQRALAEAIECSPALLNGVMKGTKKLMPPRVPKLASLAGLGPEETRYLEAMVAHELAETPELQRQALDHLVGLRSIRESRDLMTEERELFSRWWYLAIAELALCDGFRADPEWIAKTLVPQITVDQAREALHRLARIGMLVDGKAASREIRQFVIQRDLQDTAVLLLEMASDALYGVPRSERHFIMATTAVDPLRIPQLKEAIAKFNIETDQRFAAGAPHRRRVYQLSIQLFPLSKSTR